MFDDSILARLRREALKSPGRHKHAAVVLTRNLAAICYGHSNGSRHAEHHAASKLLATPSYRGKKPAAILVVREATGRDWVAGVSLLTFIYASSNEAVWTSS